LAVEHGSDEAGMVRKAVNLFTFLRRTQELLLAPIRTVDEFEKVIWFGDLPQHPAVRSAHRVANLDADAALLAVDRVGKQDPPALPDGLEQWVAGPTDDADREPALRGAIYADKASHHLADQSSRPEYVEAATGRRVDLAEVPEVAAAFADWLAAWRLWADGKRVRSVYKGLFEMQLASTYHSEEFELVVGVGCLSWRPEGHDRVVRHVATAPIAITLDENSGTLTVAQVSSPERVSIELDMLGPELIPSPADIDEIRQLGREYDAHLLDQPAMSSICRRLTHLFDPDAQYDEGALTPPTGTNPQGAFAPAIVLRRRTNRGLVQIYDQIVSQIQASGEVPSGILPLIDPDRQPESVPSTTRGAVVGIDDEDFLPLPVNEAQRRIIERVDRTAQTVVQGPPGTGKTHTAAALVSHLLAEGKRVLITAQTDRALCEVRAKLPSEIQSLAVSVIGQSRSDDLRTAVEDISRRAAKFDAAESRKSIERHLTRLHELRRERADAYARLIAIRRQEVEPRNDGPEPGTLAAIAYRHLQDQPKFEWIHDFDIDPHRTGQSVATDEIVRWRNTLLDDDIASHAAEACGRLPDLSAVLSPEDYAKLVTLEQRAMATKDKYRNLLVRNSFEFIQPLAPDVRKELRSRVFELADRAMALERRDEAWIYEALRDVHSGRQKIWLVRAAQIKSLADQAAELIARLGPTTSVVVTGGDIGVHQEVAKSLLAHIDSGKEIKALPDGSPKIGRSTSKSVKLAEPFFTEVKVNGVSAVTREQLTTFIDWVEARRAIAAMDRIWPPSVRIPDEDSLREKLDWHRTEVGQLDKVLAMGDQLEAERAWCHYNNLPVPHWNSLDDVRRYAALVEAADNAAAASSSIEALASYLRAEAQWPTSSAVTKDLLKAVESRDRYEYISAHTHLVHLHRVAQAISERDRIRAKLDQSAARLAEAIAADPAAPQWADRLPLYEEAWRWEITGRWILEQAAEDSNVLKTQLNVIEQQIRSEVEGLTADRAWGHAVAPGRLTGSARANLTQSAQLVSSLREDAGKYAAKKHAEIAEAMDRCRPSIPVWIMPIYRIAEQVRVQPNLYDVVIVDEASQVGLEATFLQYLAPKIVVIGDDKQVSRAAVGVDQQELRDLANQHFASDTDKASWQDPTCSYFDEAAMRFGGRITLTEHRRCVPEIIGFSNRIAYEPEGISLVPVRQFGSDRLEPIKVVYLAGGYETGNSTNPVEADAIVDQIRKCLADPQYGGATFGVISLLGKEQAKLIEHRLLDTVPPEEWSARQLRCGVASDFQASERDVMFLSMVNGPDPAKRISAFTAPPYLQRFNIAASRAKDQMWVYHSIPRSELTNPEDMRYQLLDYCYGVINRTHADTPAIGMVPEDTLVAPFDSVFEQRLYNRIVERGCTVWPQYQALGYNIDLMVIGAKGKLAIECDGEFWHGPAEYEADLARQHALERCGWEFFRIRESVFYADMATTLEKLWETLDELDMRTADRIEPSFDDDVASDAIVDDPPVEHTPGGRADAGTAEDSADTAPLPTVMENSLVEAAPVDRNADSMPVVGSGRHHVKEPADTGQQPSEQFGVIPVRDGGRHRAPEPEDTEELDEHEPAVAVNSGRRSAERLACADVDQLADTEALVVDVAPAKNGVALQPYVRFDEPLPAIADTPPSEIAANIGRIVATEGPVLGHRLHHAYVKASGENRVDPEIARVLNHAISLAEGRGEIVSDNPLNESDMKPKTFRLPGQPQVVPREPGPRTLNLIPPAELAHHLAELSAEGESLSEEQLFRAVIDRLGLNLLTDNA
jgi:very-short-patch-repair endonuclease